MSQTWDEADIFAVPLLNGGEGFGQVIGPDPAGALVLLTLRKGPRAVSVSPIGASEIISILRVPAQPLDLGTWEVIGFEALPRPRAVISPQRAADQTTEAAVVEAFLSACHGLLDWDFFPDPTPFDRMLVNGRPRPERVRWARSAPS